MVIKSIYQNKPFPKNSHTIVNNFRFLMFDSVNNSFIGKAAYGFGSASYLYVLFRNYFVMDVNDIDASYNDKLVISKQLGGSNIRACFYLLKHPDIKVDDLIDFSYEKKIRNLYDFSNKQPGYNLAYAVGLAIDSKLIQKASHYTKTNKIYCIVSSADLNSNYGLSALKTAINQKLDNLVIIYDNNSFEERGANDDYLITDFSTIVKKMGYKYISVLNANNVDKVDVAFQYAVNANRPAFVDINTVVGHGSEIAGTSQVLRTQLDQEELNKLIKRFEYYGEEFKVLYETANDIYPTQQTRVNKLKDLINNQLDELKRRNIVLDDYLTNYKDWEFNSDKIDSNQSLAKLKAVIFKEQPNSVLLEVNDNDYELENELNQINSDRLILLGQWIELAKVIACAIAHNKVHLPVINTDINLISSIITDPNLQQCNNKFLYLVNTPKGLSFNYLNSICNSIAYQNNTLLLQPGTYEELKYSICEFNKQNKKDTFIVLPHVSDLVNIMVDGINLAGYELNTHNYATVNIIACGADLIKALSFREELLKNGIMPRIISVLSLEHFDNMDSVAKSVLLNNFPSYYMDRMEEVAWGNVLSKNPLELNSIDQMKEHTVHFKKSKRSQKTNNNKIKSLDSRTNTTEFDNDQDQYGHYLLSGKIDINKNNGADILKRNSDINNDQDKKNKDSN
ncbi:thiamine pyrophosphate-dependent enzyme [Mycoplasma sp. T363T]|uniref:thiamine pyrophosphate-dependent enzyme n=1 Tax=Mycoplasma bradburyae TaxID=2963128 RepID=UPI0023407413|nr:thiamine pyrophosphate-dependent enzyme [Mycoplasma bradburyae]MDC4163009.1 thiamine pyrophosphate-dependent enzyme [Mycoplasma bradburyae]